MFTHHHSHDNITQEQGTGVELAVGFAIYAIGLALVVMLALLLF